jgi:hypothetical protein
MVIDIHKSIDDLVVKLENQLTPENVNKTEYMMPGDAAAG